MPPQILEKSSPCLSPSVLGEWSETTMGSRPSRSIHQSFSRSMAVRNGGAHLAMPPMRSMSLSTYRR
jgi:hypothetical protein